MRMTQVYDTRAAKRPVNLSLNADLVAKAREAGLNLSSIAEDAVAVALARLARERWDAAIVEACAAHDRYLEQYGSLGEVLRAQEQDDGAG
jgi:antitoxin CcdA